jgi:hypothetical protein
MTAASTARLEEDAGGLTGIISWGSVAENFLFNSIDTYAFLISLSNIEAIWRSVSILLSL